MVFRIGGRSAVEIDGVDLDGLRDEVALPEAAVAIDRKRRMIRNLVIKIEATEPAIGKVEFDFFA
jgi:hypothetical protein